VSLANRRSVMTLFSGRTDIYSHQVRLVLGEKGISADIIDVDPNHKPEDLIDLNPYNTLPTLVDRDLVLYESDIIMEYIDERFPHPPLLPVYPVARAKCRLLIYRMQHDWFSLYDIINSKDQASADRARKELKESLIAVAPAFADKPFFMSDEISLVDCYLAPLLWRLPKLGISLPEAADPICDYADRMFAREGFENSLSDAERELR
jgi:RNA polymerase-associated protein